MTELGTTTELETTTEQGATSTSLLVLLAAAIIGCCGLTGSWEVAADEVLVREGGNKAGTSRATGEIVDYTGQRLVLRHVGGRDEVIESPRVVDVQATWTKLHEAADALFAEGKFAEALDTYRQALGDEKRGWVRRRIVARSIWCLQYLNQTDQAIDLFLLLYRQDPSALHFDTIPLPWISRAPAPGVERRARELLESNDHPVGVLIGASWLLPTAHRPESLEALRGLLVAADPRVAFLADAQLWRTQASTVKPEEFARWQEKLSRMPHEIQAGPAFLAAQVCARLGRPEEAALLFLRVPILHVLQRDLAGQSLLEAARQLEKMDDRTGATQLYREVIEKYPRTTAADEAQLGWQKAASSKNQR